MMGISYNFRELKIWQNAMSIAKDVFSLLETFPHHEKYGLSSQISRAAVSISSNTAEGSSRVSVKEFQHYIRIAMDSSFELETQIILERQFQYINENQENEHINRLNELQKMMAGFKKTLM